MTMTIMSAAKEVSALEQVNMRALCKAISSGFCGSKGKFRRYPLPAFRGFTKGIGEAEEIDVDILCDAMQRAVETAYKAVMKPKEGTILTVARGAADRALELVEQMIWYTLSERSSRRLRTCLPGHRRCSRS